MNLSNRNKNTIRQSDPRITNRCRRFKLCTSNMMSGTCVYYPSKGWNKCRIDTSEIGQWRSLFRFFTSLRACSTELWREHLDQLLTLSYKIEVIPGSLLSITYVNSVWLTAADYEEKDWFLFLCLKPIVDNHESYSIYQ